VIHDEGVPRPRVLLAEDQPANLALLESLLDTEFDVVATVADGIDLVDAAARLRPDAIVTDITMPRLDGLRAAQQILRSNPSARIVFVTVHADPTIVRRSMDVGGLGYVPKTVAGDELVPTVWAALRGERRCLCSL
jgi:DNA-binding NarL/FixJ family response regulator